MLHSARSLLSIVLVLCLGIIPPLDRLGAQSRPPTSQGLESRLDAAEIQIRVLEAVVETQTQQLEVEREIANRAMDSVERMVQWGSLVVSLVVGAAVLFGWGVMKKRIAKAVEKQVPIAVDSGVRNLGEPRVKELITQWDLKFGELYQRVERLGTR